MIAEFMKAGDAELHGKRLCSLVDVWCIEFETDAVPDLMGVRSISADAVGSADAVVSDNPAAIRFAELAYGRNDDELRAARQFLRAAAERDDGISYRLEAAAQSV